MARRQRYSHGYSHSHHHYHFWLIVLAIIAAILAYRFLSHQGKWSSYVVESQKTVKGLKTENSIEDAKMIATTIVGVEGGSSILKQPRLLQEYIEKLSQETKRDIVIVNRDKLILAATISENVKTAYTDDEGDEVAQTITDEQPRNFIERGADYPNGIERTVISFKDLKGSIVGGIIISH